MGKYQNIEIKVFINFLYINLIGKRGMKWLRRRVNQHFKRNIWFPDYGD